MLLPGNFEFLYRYTCSGNALYKDGDILKLLHQSSDLVEKQSAHSSTSVSRIDIL